MILSRISSFTASMPPTSPKVTRSRSASPGAKKVSGRHSNGGGSSIGIVRKLLLHLGRGFVVEQIQRAGDAVLEGRPDVSSEIGLQRRVAGRGVDLNRPVEVLDGPGAMVFREMDAAQQEVRRRVLRLALEDAFRAHGGGAGVALQHQGAREAELGVELVGLEGENPRERLMRLVEMDFIEAGVTEEKKQRDVVRRLRQGITERFEAGHGVMPGGAPDR